FFFLFAATLCFFLFSFFFFFLSVPLSFLPHSRPLFTATSALLFALLAVPFSPPPPTLPPTFGWLSLTPLASFVYAIALVLITILIVWEAIERFRTPRPVEGGMMMAIAVAG
ncbi:cation transporter, partial [Escherichia coli]|uniref:cation transporter n=1 Tax=Escherichia coli TaxID=562 RepID=UPI001485852A